MQNTASARIDLAAMRHNLQVVRRLCPDARIMAMVKADAYGHGVVPVARALEEADGLAVARLHEALELRRAGLGQRLLLLGTLLDETELALCSQLQIDVTVHDALSLAAIAAAAARAPLRVWLKLDCGMHRLGLDPEAFAHARRLLSSRAGIPELVLMTHFSTTHDMYSPIMQGQIERFAACCEAHPPAQLSAANSAVLIAHPRLRIGWVRPGIMLYGENPLAREHSLPLRAAMSLRAVVIALRQIGPGEAVGYDGRWTAARTSRIATVGIGYGDGYPRHTPNGTPVWVRGQRAPLVGRVSMDSITVDVSDCAGVAVGDEVLLWGPDLPAAIIAEWARTASYELFTGLTPRVSRNHEG
jgi:alanine racemase